MSDPIQMQKRLTNPQQIFITERDVTRTEELVQDMKTCVLPITLDWGDQSGQQLVKRTKTISGFDLMDDAQYNVDDPSTISYQRTGEVNYSWYKDGELRLGWDSVVVLRKIKGLEDYYLESLSVLKEEQVREPNGDMVRVCKSHRKDLAGVEQVNKLSTERVDSCTFLIIISKTRGSILASHVNSATFEHLKKALCSAEFSEEAKEGTIIISHISEATSEEGRPLSRYKKQKVEGSDMEEDWAEELKTRLGAKNFISIQRPYYGGEAAIHRIASLDLRSFGYYADLLYSPTELDGLKAVSSRTVAGQITIPNIFGEFDPKSVITPLPTDDYSFKRKASYF